MKDYGFDRGASPGSAEYNARLAKVAEMRASGKYESVEFFKDHGGYLAIEKSTKEHSSEEIEAARYMAMDGGEVILKDEGGRLTTPDGYVYSWAYEQKTPNPEEQARKEGRTLTHNDRVKSFRHAVKHGLDKVVKGAQVDVAVVYDKNLVYNLTQVNEGLRDYEKRNRYRFKKIIVIGASGRVHYHDHNDVTKPPK